MGERGMSKRCLAVRHVAFEDLGAFADPISKAGYETQLIDAPLAGLSAIDPLDPDLLVLLGGPIGVYESDAYPFLATEIAWAKARLEADRPILGLCLGAQVMTVALGAAVKPGTKEIGVAPIELTDRGRAGTLAALGETPVLHWHGDAMELPTGAEHLARTETCEVQAWSRGPFALALQFHAEADPDMIEHWLVGHAHEIGTHGLDPRAIRADVARDGARIAAAGRRMLTDWLEGLDR